MNLTNPLILYQLSDSAFPTGSFSHSAGLEAAWQGGEVPSVEALRRFVHEALWQFGHGMLPLASSAHEDRSRLSELETRCDAFLTNAVANRASIVQGRSLLATCARIWPEPMHEVVAVAKPLRGHHAPIAGAVLAALELPLATAQQLLLYLTARGILSAAVRLGIVGPYAAQQAQSACHPDIEIVLDRCAHLRDQDIAQTAPILDLLQAGHDRLYSRLFQS